MKKTKLLWQSIWVRSVGCLGKALRQKAEIWLVKKGSEALFDAYIAEKRLYAEPIQVLFENGSSQKLKSYITCWQLSPGDEKKLISRGEEDLFRIYVSKYGLSQGAAKFLLKSKNKNKKLIRIYRG